MHSPNNNRPQLVLDIAGVLLTNLSPLFWEEIADHSKTTNLKLKTLFNTELRNDFWSGKLPEAVFWSWLHRHCPHVSSTEAKAMLSRHLNLLPAAAYLQHWNHIADIHLLSNHRYEWLTSFLSAIIITPKSITISNKVGLCKPDLRIYEHVAQTYFNSGDKILYVDDQEKNLKPAASLGWKTLLADPQDRWVKQVDLILAEL